MIGRVVEDYKKAAKRAERLNVNSLCRQINLYAVGGLERHVGRRINFKQLSVIVNNDIHITILNEWICVRCQNRGVNKLWVE